MTIVGCGPGPNDRRSISGTVTLDGQPIDGGNIQICPLSAAQNSASGAMIRAGRYAIRRESGLTPGKYRVRVFWAEKIDASKIPDPSVSGPRPPIEIKELIPARYNTASELTIDVQENGPNTFDFALSSARR